MPQSPFAPHNRSTAASHRQTSRRSPRRAPTCSLRARPSSTVSQARRARTHAQDAPRTPSAPARTLARTRATAGFGLSGLLPAAHHSAPLPPPQPRTTRPRSTACAQSSPRSPSRARPRSPPKRLAICSRVSARGVRSQRATRTLNPVLLLLPRLGRAHTEITSRRQWLHDSELLCSFVHIDGAMRVLDSDC